MATPIITQERLRACLEYFPESGLFVWRVRLSIRIQAGKIAGSNDGKSYIQIGIDGRRYLAHRLAWLYMTGAWPAAEIDHIDGEPENNRFNNLREATKSENMQNQRKATRQNLSSGLLGAQWNKHAGKWMAQIRIDGERRYLGLFPSAAEAHAAYLAEKRRIHPFSTI